MITLSHSIQDTIRGRNSVRTYEERFLDSDLIKKITQMISTIEGRPFGSIIRFQFIAAVETDTDALKGLGTYGIIRNPAGFVVGAFNSKSSKFGHEDFGYAMESLVLFMTDLGLGTCWLGGTLRKSRFAERMALKEDEIIPAVISVGHPASTPRMLERIMRFGAGSDYRKSWDALFFQGDFDHALSSSENGKFSDALEMVRLAPSASNRQPWRIVFDPEKRRFHFFIQRAKRYRPEKISMTDLQRVDMGIAMCHFEMTVNEAGLSGGWVIDAHEICRLPTLTSYVATWEAA